MAHVALYKKRIVQDFVKLFKEYPIVGVVNMENLPAKQLQQIREALRGKVVLRMTKQRLMKIVIEQVKAEKKGIEELDKYLGGMPALLFTKEDPFLLSKIIQKNRSKAPIKEGQIAPYDLVIKAGPTPFAPGPIIGELGALKIKASIEQGKVVIVRDAVIAEEGVAVNKKVADIVGRLGIEPMEIGLDLVAVYDKGEILTKEVLFVDEQEYLDKIAQANAWAMSLAVEAGYVNADTIKVFLSKAYYSAKAIALKTNLLTDDNVKDMLAKADKEALALKQISDSNKPKEG